MRRRLRFAAAVVTAGALLAGCGGTGADRAGAPATVRLWARAATAGITKALVDKFNAGGHGFRVSLTVLPLNQEDAKFAAAVRSRNVPDLFGMNDVSIPQFVRTGALRPLDDLAATLPYRDQLNAAQLDLARHDGRLYALPLMLDLSVLWYNKALFRRAGLDPDRPPSSGQELIQYAEKISALGGGVRGFTFGGNCGGCLVFTVLPMVVAGGERVLTDPPGEQRATIAQNQALRRVLELLRTLWTRNLVAPQSRTEDGATWGADFLSGRVGIAPLGIGTVLAAHTGSFELGVAPIPGPDGGYSTFTGGDEFVIPTASRHADEAGTFTRWVLDSEQQSMYPAHGFAPVRNDMLTDDFRRANPVYAVGLKAAGNGHAPATPAFQALFSNSGPWGPIFQTAVFDGDVDGALRTGQREFTDILRATG
jgi:multiple sugar transport system substrate-binding protein